MSDKIDFRTRTSMSLEKKWDMYLMIKLPIHQEAITNINIYAIIIEYKKLTKVKRQKIKLKSTHNIPLLIKYKTPRQKINNKTYITRSTNKN